MESFNINDEASGADAILHLYRNNVFTDVVIKCYPGDIDFHVHKLILSLFSPVLCDRFYGKNKTNSMVLHIEGYDTAAVKNMICFIYGEPFVFENVSQIKETKRIAEKYKILELGKICKKEFSRVAIYVTNVLMVLEMAVDYKNEDKETECLELIGRKQNIVFNSETFRKMKFEHIDQIFKKLRQRNSLTEAQYLRAAVRWLRNENNEYVDKIKKGIHISKLRMEEFHDIIVSFPNFFTSMEISLAVQEIRKASTDSESTINHAVDENMNKSFENLDLSGRRLKSNANLEENIGNGSEPESSIMVIDADVSPDVQVNGNFEMKAKVIISILDGAEGVKEAIVAIKDDIITRRLRFEITGHMNDGKFKSLSQRNGDYRFDNVDISYCGMYFIMISLQNDGAEISAANCIQAFKAAIFFELQKLQECFLVKISNIIDYDPVFLDQLRQFPYFEDNYLHLLHLNPKCIISHPHFLDCSFHLLESILNLDEKVLPSELQLLIPTILWLEARNRLRWKFRRLLLSRIAFKNISRSDLEYIKEHYSNFFQDCEMQYLLSYTKGESGTADVAPPWFNLINPVR